jgi:hypothetical protein
MVLARSQDAILARLALQLIVQLTQGDLNPPRAAAITGHAGLAAALAALRGGGAAAPPGRQEAEDFKR